MVDMVAVAVDLDLVEVEEDLHLVLEVAAMLCPRDRATLAAIKAQFPDHLSPTPPTLLALRTAVRSRTS